MTSIRLLAIAIGFGLAACAHQPEMHSGPWATIEGAEKIVAMQKELDAPSLALDKVISIRMSMDGERIEVANVLPTVIIAKPNQGNRTILNLGNREKLVLFTRDGRNIKGYRMEIPIAELVPGKSFRFPVARDPGEVVQKSFVVDRVIVQ